jgi:precorrin-3B methylase
VKSVEGFTPESAIYEVVPFGNEVVDRATASHAGDEGASVAEGSATVHASSSLVAELIVRHREVKFVPVVDAIEWC